MAEAVVALVNAGRESLNHINFFLILGIFPKAWLCFEQEPISESMSQSMSGFILFFPPSLLPRGNWMLMIPFKKH